MLLNNEWVKNEIREEIKKFLETNENELTRPKLTGHNKGSTDREVHRDTGLPKKDRNISNKQSNPTPTRTQGTTPPPRASRRKEITKIREELNDIQTKRTILRINKYRS